MSGKIRGSGNASGEATFNRTVAEAVRQSKMLAQHDETFVPPIDDASSMIAAQMFTRTAEGSAVTQHTLTFGTHLDASDASYDGSADATIDTDATDANTPDTIVARDSAGSFEAETITANTLVSNGDVTASGGTVHGLHVTGGDVVSAGDVLANAGTVHGLHVTGGDITSSSSISCTSGTGTFLHLSAGDLTVTGGGAITTASGTVTGLHAVFGDVRINIAPTVNALTATHTIPISVNGVTYLMLLHS